MNGGRRECGGDLSPNLSNGVWSMASTAGVRIPLGRHGGEKGVHEE